MYKGEYSNGKKNGEGKEYNYSGDLIFTGNFINDQRWNGKEKKYYQNRLSYEINYENGEIKDISIIDDNSDKN